MSGPFPVRIKDAGIDYLTTTTSGEKRLEWLRSRIELIAAQEVKKGNQVRPWGMAGFNGYAVGGLQFGVRGPTLLCRLSGPTAARHWKPFSRDCDNCSRIDLQTTVEYDREPSKMIANHFRQIKKFRKGKVGAAALTLLKTADGPSTLYLGKRSSDRFARIYDKRSESTLAHYEKCVRYEVEFKNDLADLVRRDMLNQEDPQAASAAGVYTFLVDRGARLLWQPDTRRQYSLPRSRSEAGKCLQWLAESVSPSIQMLLASGYYAEVLTALSLPAQPMAHMAHLAHAENNSSEVS